MIQPPVKKILRARGLDHRSRPGGGDSCANATAPVVSAIQSVSRRRAGRVVWPGITGGVICASIRKSSANAARVAECAANSALPNAPPRPAMRHGFARGAARKPCAKPAPRMAAANPAALVCADVLQELPAAEQQGRMGEMVRRLFAAGGRACASGGPAGDGSGLLSPATGTGAVA